MKINANNSAQQLASVVVGKLIERKLSLRFEVEYILTFKGKKSKSVIIARLLDEKTDFSLTENSRLGGIEITPNLGMPRILDKDGNPRFDIVAFELKYRNDHDKLYEGQIVELSSVNTLD